MTNGKDSLGKEYIALGKFALSLAVIGEMGISNRLNELADWIIGASRE